MWGLFLSLLGWIGLSPVPFLASIIGATEPALKLLISILMGYVLGIVYHKYVIKDYKNQRDLFLFLSGLDMAYYNFGFSLIHNAIPVIVFYLTMTFISSRKLNSTITFIFNISYLLIGYAVTESEDYDITWTMPHCVLTLKMIALAFDLWDGEKMLKGQELSANSKLTALTTPPTLLELFGFVYFPACFLVGPIFSFRRYKDFLTKFPLESERQTYESDSVQRLLQGLLYLTAFQIGISVFDVKYMMTEEFLETSIFYRHFYCGLWAHFALYKYISCWLLTEAACIRFGLSYNGTETKADGRTVSKWDGCNNIKLLQFEGATKFQHYIDSFNCNTNHFAAEYVYKRLKFLGNRNASQFFTLLFLALWHGIRSGYYMTFFNEFIIILMEKDLESMISKTELYEKIWNNEILKYVLYALLKTYTIVFMGWSLAPFDLKVFHKWWAVYSSLWFSGFILFLPWALVYKPLVKSAVKGLRAKSNDRRE